MLDGSLLFEEHTTKQTRNTRKFLKRLRDIPKICLKILHNAPRREIDSVNFS